MLWSLAARRRRPAPTVPARRRGHRPRLEGLESRDLLAAPSLGYALDIGGTSQTWGESVAVDGSGDAVMSGHFSGTVNFDPSNPADTAATLTSPSYYDSSGNLQYVSDGYIARYDPNGSLLWVHALDNASGPRVAIDPAGNIYASGSVSGTTTVGSDAHGNPVTITGPSSGSFYVVKYTPDGTAQWAKAVGGGSFLNAFATDGAGNTYLAVGFTGSTTVGSRTLSSTNGNVYLAKIDATGNLAWVDQFAANPHSLACDASGNIYLSGDFFGTVDFDPGPGTYSLYSGGRSVQPSEAAFAEKLNASGGFVWADAFQANQWSSSWSSSIALDATGNVYIAGGYGGTVDFDPGKAKYSLTTNSNSGDAYVSKLTNAGGFVWVRSVGGTGNASVTAMAIDPSGNIDLTGTFNGTVDFDPGAGAYNLTSADTETFVEQLTAAGGSAWVITLATRWPAGLAVDAAGDIFLTGYFSGTVDFDPNGTDNLTSQAQDSQDGFLWKLKK